MKISYNFTKDMKNLMNMRIRKRNKTKKCMLHDYNYIKFTNIKCILVW
jgi:hypothetical protein